MFNVKRFHHTVVETHPAASPDLGPDASCVAAVQLLAQRVPNMRAVFDQFGQLRSLTTNSAGGLYNAPLLGKPDAHAKQFLGVPEVGGALGLAQVVLSRGATYDKIPNLGYRVSYPQEVKTGTGARFPVRESFVHVFMNESGKVFSLSSTLCHHTPQVDMAGIITEEQAMAAARVDLGKLRFDTQRAELLFCEHEGALQPMYEVVITANKPRKVVMLLVTAHGGKVVLKRNLLKASAARRSTRVAAQPTPAIATDRHPRAQAAARHKEPASSHRTQSPSRKRKNKDKGHTGKTPVKATGRVFLRIPDPQAPVDKQLFDMVLDRLPDPKVLQNENLIMYTGSGKKAVKARNSGDFNYPVGSPEFCAVLVFFALDAQIEYMKSRGLRAFPQAIPVFVEDRSVSDNAYFDPEAYEIHIGIGSGLTSGGLNRYIAYDYGVEWHEDGHNFVYLQTPGKDLPGRQGGGIHEAIGDMCDLLMDWTFRHQHAAQLGQTFGVAEVEADPRIIGTYAAPPDGIRIQKNDKKSPGDETGEPHDDGLIIGGAMADLLVSMVKRDGVPQGLDNFASLMLAALAIVPAQQVTFRDLLNAFLTADSQIASDANKDRITKCFAAHGIKLSSARHHKRGTAPVRIISNVA